MINTEFVSAYEEHLKHLQTRFRRDEAFQRAVGGDFVAMGKLEFYLLMSLGLKDDDLVVDVGCGSGRLAAQLARLPRVIYLGTDVVADLLSYASEVSGRVDFMFVRTDGVSIPLSGGSADFVCFFSVLTHLLHEDSFRYFREAARVLKPGGLLVMSFLEFRVPAHWEPFIGSVEAARPGQHLNQFIEVDAIQAWAKHAGFEVESIRPGDTAHIPIPEEIVFENGARYQGHGSFGQSVAVLRKK